MGSFENDTPTLYLQNISNICNPTGQDDEDSLLDRCSLRCIDIDYEQR